MASRTLLYVAAGAGLGHLTRACAVALHLARRSVRTRILTHSLHADALRRLTGCRIDFLPAARWVADAPRRVLELRPHLVALDAFPWGLRGEWRGVGGLKFVTLARRLKIDAYLKASGGRWEPESPTLRHVIACEPLAADHRALLEQGGGEVIDLPGRIRFPAEEVTAPIPGELAAMFDRGPTWLVVHGGPVEEVELLVGLAEDDRRRQGGGQLAVVTPRTLPSRGTVEYFPAARLFAAATRVVTAAGYNSVAELSPYPQKRLCYAFERKYDDQAGRLATGDGLPDGAAAAAGHLQDLMEA